MKKKVLAVDDDTVIREIVKQILENEGYEVILKQNGQEAFEFLDNQSKPLDLSLIILDVMMPGMTGIDILTRLKLHSHTNQIPVMMLTGEDKSDDLVAGYQTGADLYVTKPLTRQQLLRSIKLARGE